MTKTEVIIRSADHLCFLSLIKISVLFNKMEKQKKYYLGFDLGASSGRAIVGTLVDKTLDIREINRFPNGPVALGKRLNWNFLFLWQQVLESMRICEHKGFSKLAGIGIDTWGVDFGLLMPDGNLLGYPICYRDPMTQGIYQLISSIIGSENLYRLTGLAPAQVTTLSQLVALKRSENAGIFNVTDTFLMMPDLFRYFLCGNVGVEQSAAGSSQLTNIRQGTWCRKIFRTFKLPLRIMPDIIKPATVVGHLLPELAESSGLNQAPVVAVAGHDTATAAAAVPFVDEHTAFISSGTWSVVGIITDAPITTPKSLESGFVNEFGLACILFVKNIMGLYLFENLRRALARQDGTISYAKMIQEASQAKPFACMINANAPMLFRTEDPESSIRKFLRETGQKDSHNQNSMIRALLEALAFSYREALNDLRILTGRDFKRVCIVGGGSRNHLLCQMAANAMGLEVLAGPAEATAAGNLAMQALATGELNSPTDIRNLIKRTFKLRVYKPQSRELWDKNMERYQEIIRKSVNLR